MTVHGTQMGNGSLPSLSQLCVLCELSSMAPHWPAKTWELSAASPPLPLSPSHTPLAAASSGPRCASRRYRAWVQTEIGPARAGALPHRGDGVRSQTCYCANPLLIYPTRASQFLISLSCADIVAFAWGC